MTVIVISVVEVSQQQANLVVGAVVEVQVVQRVVVEALLKVVIVEEVIVAGILEILEILGTQEILVILETVESVRMEQNKPKNVDVIMMVKRLVPVPMEVGGRIVVVVNQKPIVIVLQRVILGIKEIMEIVVHRVQQ